MKSSEVYSETCTENSNGAVGPFDRLPPEPLSMETNDSEQLAKS